MIFRFRRAGRRRGGGDSWTRFANRQYPWLTNLGVEFSIDMFDKFYGDVLTRLKRMQEVERLAARLGDDFDEHIGYQVLERGQRLCDTEYLALLYAYRYGPMHHAALRSVFPDRSPDVLIDFGGGPGTAMLALSSNCGTTFERLSLELAQGMRALASGASRLKGSMCKRNSEHAFPDSRFWEQAAKMADGRAVLLVFSYFFAQELTRPFVRALANRISALSPSSMTLVYTNPVGPSASWMPNGDMHGWYKEFAKCLGHHARIRCKTYEYKALRNMTEPVNRSGECAYEVWRVR